MLIYCIAIRMLLLLLILFKVIHALSCHLLHHHFSDHLSKFNRNVHNKEQQKKERSFSKVNFISIPRILGVFFSNSLFSPIHYVYRSKKLKRKPKKTKSISYNVSHSHCKFCVVGLVFPLCCVLGNPNYEADHFIQR